MPPSTLSVCLHMLVLEEIRIQRTALGALPQLPLIFLVDCLFDMRPLSGLELTD